MGNWVDYLRPRYASELRRSMSNRPLGRTWHEHEWHMSFCVQELGQIASSPRYVRTYVCRRLEFRRRWPSMRIELELVDRIQSVRRNSATPISRIGGKRWSSVPCSFGSRRASRLASHERHRNWAAVYRQVWVRLDLIKRARAYERSMGCKRPGGRIGSGTRCVRRFRGLPGCGS